MNKQPCDMHTNLASTPIKSVSKKSVASKRVRVKRAVQFDALFRSFITGVFSIWGKMSKAFVKHVKWVPHVEPYIGYGTGEYARLICRTVYGNADWSSRSLKRGIRGVLAMPAPRVPIAIDIDGMPLRSVQVGRAQVYDEVDRSKNMSIRHAISDHSGYLDLVAECNLRPGIHKVHYRIEGAQAVTDDIFSIAPGTQVGIISDVDDTIMISAVPTIWKAAYNLLLLNPKKRAPVPGMSVLYTKIADMFPEAPFFYLSTSPWNVENSIRHFITEQGYPEGPLLLRDIDPHPKTFIPTGVQHKLEFARQLMTDFPHMKFILLGDDGQKDPTTYATIAQQYPGRVIAIGIRQLSVKESGLQVPGMGSFAMRQPMPVTDVPVFMGTSGSNLMKTMLPYLRRFSQV